MEGLGRLFSRAARRMTPSDIHDLLRLTQSSDVVSFAGGLPNPQAFPVEEVKRVADHVMASHARDALQYGTTEGDAKLRAALVHGMKHRYGVNADVASTIVTHGSQQGLYLLAQVLLDPGDVVLTTAPTYIGALDVFRSFQAEPVGVPQDEGGVVVDLLEERLERLARERRPPKFVYLVPTFQNPAGVTIPASRRRAIYDLLCAYELVLVEDDPYSLLRYEGEDIPPIKAFDSGEGDRVLYLGTFSKLLAPGFRIAWACGPPPIVNRMVLAKQSLDLCTNTFGQSVVYEAIHHDLLLPHIEAVKPIYRAKRDAMLEAMDEHFPREARWNRPEGGLFIWVELPEGVDTRAMLQRALAHKVAYVSGSSFYPDGSGLNTMRLNFSHPSDDEIREGVKRLAEVVREELARSGPRKPGRAAPARKATGRAGRRAPPRARG